MEASPQIIEHPHPSSEPAIQVVLAGNPNSGKTALFNALTGLRHKVANYPGVTVERKEGKMLRSSGKYISVIDLPGIYSLAEHAPDEIIATRTLIGRQKGENLPALVVSVVDASNLERNLYLTTQLIDLGVPVILALNMIDVAQQRGFSIKVELLSRLLDIPVVSLVATKGKGLEQLKHEIEKVLESPRNSTQMKSWLPKDSTYIESAEELGSLLEVPDKQLRFVLGSMLLSDSGATTSPTVLAKTVEIREKLLSKGIEPHSFEASNRYRWINQIVTKSSSQVRPRKYLSEKIDTIATHPLWGFLIFVLIMALVFQAIFLWASMPMDLIDTAFSGLGRFVGEHIPSGDFRSLVVDGIIAGVGSVVIFLPQIAILFFLLGLLEESGYLTRGAFMMDKLLRKCGLQGRSFIPLLSSFACAIPGILSTRSIASFSDRMTTILVAPLMSCSARLPVYTLLIAAFVPNQLYFGFVSLQGLVLLSMYLLGIVGAAFMAWILKISLFRGEPALFLMEMPPFRLPVLKLVLREVLDRILIFLKSAGTIILACSVVLWFLATYPKGGVEKSFAGQIGKAIEPVIEPLGFNWEIGVGLLASFAAREVFVSSLATVYNIENSDDTAQSLVSLLQEKQLAGTFTLATALSLMVFYVFACQCISTLAVCKRETGSWKWPVFMLLYMTALAYLASFLTYNGVRYFIG